MAKRTTSKRATNENGSADTERGSETSTATDPGNGGLVVGERPEQTFVPDEPTVEPIRPTRQSRANDPLALARELMERRRDAIDGLLARRSEINDELNEIGEMLGQLGHAIQKAEQTAPAAPRTTQSDRPTAEPSKRGRPAKSGRGASSGRESDRVAELLKSNGGEMGSGEVKRQLKLSGPVAKLLDGDKRFKISGERRWQTVKLVG